jgi:hypothetical protein
MEVVHYVITALYSNHPQIHPVTDRFKKQTKILQFQTGIIPSVSKNNWTKYSFHLDGDYTFSYLSAVKCKYSRFYVNQVNISSGIADA